MIAGSNQSRDMGHVRYHGRTNLLGDLTNSLEVDDPRIRTRADHNHLGLVFVRQVGKLVVIDPLIVLSYAIRYDLVELTREIERVAMCQMSAMRKIHA